MSQRGAELDRVIGISNYYRDRMAERMQWSPDKISVIYNGIALDEYKVNEPLPALPTAPTLGYFARFAPEKGLPTLVNAFGYLKGKNTPENLVLRAAGSLTPGDQKFFDALKADIAKRGLNSSIFIETNVSKARKIEFLRGLSVFSVPATLGEGFGLYLLEAWASGVPVVQPRTAAFTELLELTKGGVLYDPEDAYSLAAQAEPLLSNPAKAREIGAAAREVVKERFSAERMAKDFLALA
jgi:glycosyltransferase involved in cell wall biosynthesis